MAVGIYFLHMNTLKIAKIENFNDPPKRFDSTFPMLLIFYHIWLLSLHPYLNHLRLMVKDMIHVDFVWNPITYLNGLFICIHLRDKQPGDLSLWLAIIGVLLWFSIMSTRGKFENEFLHRF